MFSNRKNTYRFHYMLAATWLVALLSLFALSACSNTRNNKGGETKLCEFYGNCKKTVDSNWFWGKPKKVGGSDWFWQ